MKASRFTDPARTRLRRFLPVLVGGPVLASAFLVAPSAAQASDTQASHFIQTATSSNTDVNYTVINNGASNDNPNALLFVTPNYDPGQACGCNYSTAPVGVYYDTSRDQWEIFNEDETNMTVGESFNVLVVPAPTATAFTVTANSSNASGDHVDISNSAANGKPTSEILATHNLDPGGVGDTYDNQPVGVYDAGSKWAIFNVLIGAAGGGTESTVKAKTKTISDDAVVVKSPVTNGDSNAFALETPNWNPGDEGGTYDAAPTGVYYDHALFVVNEDQSGMSVHTAFNVLAWNS
jgi:hypothetical protein